MLCSKLVIMSLGIESPSNVLWFMDYRILLDLPTRKDAFDVGLESGREGFGNLMIITQTVTFCHHGLIGIREQRREPLDIVVWLL